MKVNNRVLLGIALVSCLMGCLLMSDWQAIGSGDVCSLPTNLSALASDNVGSGKVPIDSNNCSSHQCFWNPESRVTGEFCNTCLPTCLSQQASLNFYQFSVGVFLISAGSWLGYVFISAVASDITSVESQVEMCCRISNIIIM